MINIPNPNKRGKYGNAHTGTFMMKHPEKYCGTQLPVYKSELERLFMKYADVNPNIIQWGYETAGAIKYLDQSCNPAKVRRYYVDFVCKIRIGSVIKTVWIEIKSKGETRKPKSNSNPKTILTWIKNTCKWQAARIIAKNKGYEFKILTEDQLI